MESQDKTSVTFYIDKDKSVFAYFQNEVFDLKGNNMSYSHIGQHSACSPSYVKYLKKATQKHYAKLANELTAIGYNLDITN